MHPTRLIPSYDPYTDDSLVITGAEGDYVFTPNGKLLDLNGGAYWTTILGNGDKGVRAAMNHGFSADLFGWLHPPAMELAECLCGRTGYARVSFGTSGSDAVDTAIRMVYQYQRACGHGLHGSLKKTDILVLKNGFHGTTLATLATSGFIPRQNLFRMASSTHALHRWVVDPSITSTEQAREELARELLTSDYWSSIGAFLFEPVQGVAGIRPVNPHCYRAIAEKCREHGALIIADEVTTGIGRTGRFLASEALDSKPDIVTLGKALTNGEFPLSATLITDDVWRKLDAASDDPLEKYLFGSCYAGHPTGCLAAIEVLRRLDDGLLVEIRAKGERIGALLNAWKQKHAIVRDIRGVGLMWGIELPSFETCDRVSRALVTRGIRCGVEGRVLTIFPNCTMDVDRTIGQLTSALDDIVEEWTP